MITHNGRWANSTEYFVHQGGQILQYGSTVFPRGIGTKELIMQHVELLHPEERCIVLPHRHDNIFAKIAETLWMIAGRDDIEWLSYYLPRAPQFSDNGRTWRGAYGPRIRNWNGADGKVDQLDYVRNALLNDPTTRQAVISIWDPSIDTKPGKDIPCNNWLQFMIRDGLLHMSIAQRSSDLMWGYSGIDAFSWSVLHEMVAFWAGVEQGMSFHFIGSQHIYENHFPMMNKICGDFQNNLYDHHEYMPPVFKTKFTQLDTALLHVFALEKAACSGSMSFNGVWDDISNDEYLSYDPFLTQCAQMLTVYCAYKYVFDKHGKDNLEEHKVAFLSLINKMEKSDFRIAALEYMSRYVTVDKDVAHEEDVEELKRLNIL